LATRAAQRPRSSAADRRGGAYARALPALNLRTLSALAVALALFLQLALAERHFEPLFSGSPVVTLQKADGTPVTPVAPFTGAPVDDCAVCQFLALGAATDVPHESIELLRPAISAATPPSVDRAAPRTSACGSHQPRAPPASLSLA
jgi:hypothetical protein